MKFKLGGASRLRLKGVDHNLVKVVERAIELSEVDFTVFEGLRDRARQAQLLASGASTTMNSRHITGHAVDLVPLVGGRPTWDWGLCFIVAEAMQKAAKELDVKVTWGGVWDKDMSEYDECFEEHLAYVGRKKIEFKKKGIKRAPFVDGPHFELTRG